MAKILKIDNDFIPYPVSDGDELFRNGFFEFNITRIIDEVRTNNLSVCELSVSEFPREFSSINESHMNMVRLGQPVILLEISPGRYNLVDGHHRVEEARRLGLTKIMAYKLGVDEHVRFLMSKKAYLSYIEYWNSKLE